MFALGEICGALIVLFSYVASTALCRALKKRTRMRERNLGMFKALNFIANEGADVDACRRVARSVLERKMQP